MIYFANATSTAGALSPRVIRSRVIRCAPIRGGWRARLAGLVVLVALGSTSCGAADPPVSCIVTPSSCGAGMTCWPVDMGGTYACLESKNYVALGDDCALLVSHTTCGDGFICAPMTGKNNVQQSRCTPYCDPSHPCPAEATCTPVSLFLSGPQVAVCILPPPT